ncbi:MAG TPA: glycosyltransferase [Usitatibacter sp.]|nr:glycosyltransferase [Usitatibacter sp.]
MTSEVPRDIKYSLDRFIISGRRVFCWGWAADRTRAVRELELHVEGAGWQGKLPAVIGLGREDVERTFPGWANVASSGFVATGYLPGTRPQRLAVEIRLADDTRVAIDVSEVVRKANGERPQRRQLAWLLGTVWRRVRQGDLKGIVQRARAQNYGATSLDERSIAKAVLPMLDGLPVSVVFDHNMGGGANHYRRRVVAERLAGGNAVVQCTYNLPTLDYRLTIFRPGQKETVFRIARFVLLERLMDAADVRELFLNSPVSFDEPLLLAEWLAGLRRQYPRTRLTVTAHDYLAVCPSFVLLNADGRYCGIPDVTECASCMKRHRASFVSLSPRSAIGPWRALWGDCLQAADEVRCFSESTVRHLLRAYPGLPRDRLKVVPHDQDFVPSRLPRVRGDGGLVIGVMGQVSQQKGAAVVKELAALIEAEGHDARIVVIGTLDVAVESRCLQVTGSYSREQLVDLIEAHGVNVFLFPSIWPETFSYVVSEMMALDMPVVAFDLGAPAERLRGYAKARLCAEVSARAALECLLDVRRDLRRSPPPLLVANDRG